MSERVTMPALGESVTEGTVTRWLKNVGDTVAVDEPLLEVSTDKVDTEIPSPVAGVLQEILAGEDDTVPVGADLAVIGDGSESGAGGSQGGSADAQQGDQGGQQGDVGASPVPETPSVDQEPQQQNSEPESSQQGQPSQDQQDGQPQGGDSGGGETVRMPALGESVTEGTVTRWLKAEGDRVEVDEPLLEVSTDKVDTEIPSPVAGVLTKILVAEDDTVPVGGDLAVIGGSAPAQQQSQPAQEQEQPQPAQEAPKQQEQAPAQEQAPQQAPAVPAPAQAPQAQAPQAQAPQAAPEQAPAAPAQAPQADGGQAADASAYVTPLVRKLAADNNVDLGALTGTGIGGRIRKQDVLDAAKAAQDAAQQQSTQQQAPAEPAAAPASAAQSGAAAASRPAAPSPKRGTTEKMSRLRQTIAKRMVESLHVSAQLTTVVEVDVTKIARLRARAKSEFERREGTKLSFLPFFALASVEALKAHPTVNASVEGDQVTYHGSENLGVAVDTERGLLVPVIKDAGDLNIAGLARKIADLAERTRGNKITPDELGGGTFTLTNTGSRGALFDTPIINQPNVAILGTGAVVKRPVVVTDVDGGETIAIRSMAYLALSYDHRIVDGADAARFLTTMKARLEEGNFEADLGL
ncbi:2-oxoglutarate dehydrogenase, E2 component, dihydrolipoamide succinyltransferase [Pedococcus sp.]|uniref:2-oxoglutarate dehydrogenase, E2 component, dihydrolipoamide succinyltransferase n=1 Tax=Pedococcus sp. TaxID=2860345 RepID=UPI002E11DB3A|nr:2-oxoglutarate dehydrogenase, E2 component, dihydrolipoamide succinyltransferase [Pedococcus sp.]